MSLLIYQPMTITRIGDLTATAVDVTSHKIYFQLGLHDDVKLVVKNTGATYTLDIIVKCWSDPQNPIGRVFALPTVDDIDTVAIAPVSPVGTTSAAVAYIDNTKTYTHMEVDYSCTGSAAETTDLEIYIVGRVHQ